MSPTFAPSFRLFPLLHVIFIALPHNNTEHPSVLIRFLSGHLLIVSTSLSHSLCTITRDPCTSLLKTGTSPAKSNLSHRSFLVTIICVASTVVQHIPYPGADQQHSTTCTEAITITSSRRGRQGTCRCVTTPLISFQHG
jgi:hypothetical protein